MIHVNNIAVYNFENAMRGARNAYSSWDKMDSHTDENRNFVFGENDLKLAKNLCKAGSDHRKFIRQIFVSMDIYAPIYWWKEFDTYKIGTVANSTSTMHKIHTNPFSIDDFSCDHMNSDTIKVMQDVIACLENLRVSYNETKSKDLWYSLIQLLPSSYNQLRTCSLNYEVLASMYFARKFHKLSEWTTFCDCIEQLPYMKELIIDNVDD